MVKFERMNRKSTETPEVENHNQNKSQVKSRFVRKRLTDDIVVCCFFLLSSSFQSDIKQFTLMTTHCTP